MQMLSDNLYTVLVRSDGIRRQGGPAKPEYLTRAVFKVTTLVVFHPDHA